jgi:hypothetical protein
MALPVAKRTALADSGEEEDSTPAATGALLGEDAADPAEDAGRGRGACEHWAEATGRPNTRSTMGRKNAERALGMAEVLSVDLDTE